VHGEVLFDCRLMGRGEFLKSVVTVVVLDSPRARARLPRVPFFFF